MVDMESIANASNEIQEIKSPPMNEASPAKRPRWKDTNMTREEWKKKRKEELKREREEQERREKEPPKQHSLLKVKTSVGGYPVMNYVSPFTNDEISTGKRCHLNGWRRPPKPKTNVMDSPMAKPRALKMQEAHQATTFSLSITQMGQPDETT